MAGGNTSGGSLSISGGYINLTGVSGTLGVQTPSGAVSVPYGRFPFFAFGPIDLTKYSKVQFTMGAGSGTAPIAYASSTPPSTNAGNTTPLTGTSLAANTTTTINISSYTGNNYIVLVGMNGTAKCRAILLS